MTYSRELSTAKKRRQRERRRSERVEIDGRLVHPRAQHGTAGAYSNLGCQCEQCTQAWSDRVRSRRAVRWAARVPNEDGALVAVGPVQHGRPATYHNWGCHCQPCLDAAAAAKRAWSSSSRRVAS